MTINLTPQLAAALQEQARQNGVAPESLALDVLRERFLPIKMEVEPRDEWERGLIEAARDWGISLPNSAMSSEELYD